MSFLHYVLLFFTGALASGINAVAGGGTLLSFPILTLPAVGVGLAEKVANATNSVGLWPGSLAGGFGFRNLIGKTGHYFKTLFVPTLFGSTLGAVLLLQTSNATFKQVIPWLILLAAILLVLQPKVKALVGHGKTLPFAAGWGLQFLVSLYGGYFGAGMGIMMLACFALYMEGNIHELNAVKNWLGVIINFVATVVFAVHSVTNAKDALIRWDIAPVLVVGAICGGYASAHISQRLDPNKLRLAIATYGFVMAIYFFRQAYF